MSAHTDPGIMAMMREMCARLSEVGLTDTQTHAIVAAYDAIVAERDAAVRDGWKGAFKEALNGWKTAQVEVATLRARLAACELVVEGLLQDVWPVNATTYTIGKRHLDALRAAVAAETQGET